MLDRTELEFLTSVQARLRQAGHPAFDSTILAKDESHRREVHEAIRSVLSAKLRLLSIDRRIILCTFVVKAAQRPDGEVPLHQDWCFFDESAGSPIGVWCPLVDVDEGNGCLQVVKGSHRVSAAPRPVRGPFAFPDLVPLLRQRYLRSIPMRAGDAMIFDQRLFHASLPNHSATERVAATAVLVPAAAALRYYHVEDPVRAPWSVEVFAVENDFYLRHRPGRRPESATTLGTIDLRSYLPDTSILQLRLADGDADGRF
jgi:ectoine hydroxylase-related dioxygenase (phytanoyl-CoA dioxygenase family)